MRFVPLLLVLGGCDLGGLCFCDDGSPRPYVGVDRTSIFLGESIQVITSWRGTCGTMDEPYACNEQSYTVDISCQGVPCSASPIDTNGDYAVTPSGATPPIATAQLTIKLTNTGTGEVHTDTELMTVTEADGLVLTCRDLDTGDPCATPIPAGTRVAMIVQATGAYGPYTIAEGFDVSFSGVAAASCDFDWIFGQWQYACEWDDGLTATTEVTATFLGNTASDTLTVM
jgi:hypothetical protein